MGSAFYTAIAFFTITAISCVILQINDAKLAHHAIYSKSVDPLAYLCCADFGVFIMAQRSTNRQSTNAD